MTIDLDHIRERSPIEQLVNEKFSLRKTGTRFVGVEHDSLVVTPKTGFYFWNSQGEHGDVFDFVGRYHLGYGSAWNNLDATQFIEAVRFLAKRAGISIEEENAFHQSVSWSFRQLVTRLHEALLNTPKALNYATQTRGWSQSNIRASRLGFMPKDKRKLLTDLNLPDSWRSIIQKFPAEMLVYLHFQNGRLVYLSGRSIEGKRHYNPPRDLIGERQPFYNHCYSSDTQQVVLVEGQADAVTFAEWDIPAIAIAGMAVSDDLLEVLKSHRRIFIALDNVPETVEQTRTIAQTLGSIAYLPSLPKDIKDANEWLVRFKANPTHAANFLNEAKPWLESEINRVGNMMGLAREDGIRDLFQYTSQLDEFGLARFKEQMAKIGIRARAFNDLLKATQSTAKEKEEETMPEILGDDVPLLSPALGFQRDVALLGCISDWWQIRSLRQLWFSTTV